ncbi:MAG: hypothetical protein ACR2MG_07910 [Pyrinomonadaceae bacterium]
MKIKILLFVTFLFSFTLISYAQNIKITPKKTVYKRIVKKGFEDKKTVTITYPKVSGLSAALYKKVENTISYERVFDFKLKEALTDTYWLDNASYETEYNKNSILGIALTIEGSGAYPSIYTKHVVVSAKTGLQVKPEDVFIRGKNAELAKLVEGEMQKSMKQSIAEAAKEYAEDGKALTEMLADKKFTTKELSHFSVNDKGVTFFYDYGFPHVNLALEPNGEFFVPFSRLKTFIRRDGLLARFIR